MTNLCDSQIELEQTLWEKSQPPHNAYGRLQPQLLQANFHGFNLVGYNGKVYGLSLALGPVDLTRTTREQIERWQESGLCIVRSGASNSGPATNGAPTNTSADPSSSLRFSRHKCLAYDDGERDRAILRRIAEAMLSQGGNVAVAGTARLTRYLLKLCPEVKEKLACVLAEDEASAPDFQGLPVVKITAVPSEVRSVFIASAEHRDIERLTSFLPRRVAVYTLESILELDKSLVPPAAWVKRVDHLYPINIPEIEVQAGLDFLLVDLPARSIAQMPAGLAYVHNAVKKCGFRFQTLDCDIIMYHRFHSHRLLDGVEEVRTTSGYLLPDDPWQPEHYLRWESDEFLDYFRTDLEEIIRKIVAAKPRSIGLSLQQANLKVSRMVIEGVKKAAPDTTVIVGGMSCLQPEAAKRIMPAADYVVVGEADLVIGPLLGDVLAGRKPQNIPGVWAKNDAEGRLFSPGPMVMDLNELEPPRYDWTDIQLYRNWNGYQLTPVVGSRGCRWARCTFCAERFKWRSRSAENIVNELQWLCSRGFTNIVFNESDFHGDPQLIARMCREIVRLGLKLSITAQLRCHKSVDADYFRLLYSAGVRCLRFGVDGGSANVLKLEKKGYTKDMIRRNLRDAASAGIFTEVNLVVGVPGETEEDVEETIEFLKELQPHIGRLAFINPLMLFRGSDYWDYPEKFHICLHSDREELLRNYPVAIPDKEWHSENPFIDHQVRYARVNRIVRALRKNGMPLGDYALRTADRLEEAEKAQETLDNPALGGATPEQPANTPKQTGRIEWSSMQELLRIVYCDRKLDTGNEFSLDDAVALHTLGSEAAREGAKFLEIGSWKGRSSIVLAGTLSGSNGALICVDTWQGSSGVVHHEQEVRKRDVLELFQHNLSVLGLRDQVTTKVSTSAEAAQGFKDECFDLVFIDGDHRYSGILADIKAYLPKLKPGGILCGHDCEVALGDLAAEVRDQVEANCERDFLPDENSRFKGLHPGVIKAVHEYFGGSWRRADRSAVWFLKKSLSLSSLTDEHENNRLLQLVTNQLETHPLLLETRVPELVESGYEGFNLVTYRGEFWGLALSLGPVDLSTVSEEFIAAAAKTGKLHRAKCLSGLKDLISLRGQLAIVNQARNDFRRTQWGNLYYGVPRSLGPVNFDNPAERNLPQILTSRTSEGLEQAIVRASRPKAAAAPPTLLERGVGAFNLFQVDSVYVAVPSEVTSLNVNQLREGAYGKFLASESLDKLRQRIANTPEHPTIRTNRPLIIGSGSPDWTRQIVAALKCKTAVSLVTDERTAPAEWPHIVADPTSRDSLAAQLRMAAFDLVVVCYGPHLGTVPWESLVAPNCRRLLAVFPSGSARLYEDNHFTRILYNMAYLRSMYRALPSLHGARVIELGCSDGLTCELVTHEGASSVVGVDSLETVGLLYQNPRCAFLKEDATNLPFSDGSFDVAYSIATLEHVSQPLAMLSEMRRLLRPGGYGYVQTAPFYYAPFGHHMFGYFDEMPWIHVRLSKTEIAEYARTTGVAQRIEKEQGCSVEEYVESMINLEHVNGLLPHEYRVEDFAKANDIEVLRFATSREGENLLDSAIIEQVRPVRPHHLTTHGFELVFKKIGQAH